MKFHIQRNKSNIEVDNAELRLLIPAIPGKTTAQVQLFQILGAHKRHLQKQSTIYVSPISPKWCELDVTKLTKDWINGDRNLRLELECSECRDVLRPITVNLNVLVYQNKGRRKRAATRYERRRKTECRENEKKKRCCRHKMKITFKDLDVPQINTIIQPKSFEAGFCKGRCPANYNFATNHSRIQSLWQKKDKSGASRRCCSPSKLEHLEILRVDAYDNTKLVVEKWENMKVVECACS